MLDLSDPLWEKLDDAFGDGHISTLLSGLAVSWNDDTASSLLWGNLCHQETCYGTTYAAVPHLLKIADSEINRHQRREIALFLGFVVLCALERVASKDEPFQGLPETVEGWERKRDCYRSLITRAESVSDSLRESLPRYKEILATEPVNAGDLEKIRSIKAEFLSALPAIRSLCERALFENLQDEEVVRLLLSGIAAADGCLSLARLLNCGVEGQLRCSSCGWWYEYILFGDRIAIYEDPIQTTLHSPDDKALRDYRDGMPSRADGFITPVAEDEIPDTCSATLLSLAKQAPSPELALLLRHFAGSFLCCKCGVRGPLKGA
jgi:hypothetical protein